VRPIGFHFFSASVLVSHAYVHVVEAGEPVTIGGLLVRPGDLLHGDEHGVTSIPVEIARDLPDACRRIEDAEQRFIRYVRSTEASREEIERRYGNID
jgi:regulator of RNase E activity RraA